MQLISTFFMKVRKIWLFGEDERYVYFKAPNH